MSNLKISLEPYGCQTPVFVREILDSAIEHLDTSTVSFGFNDSGWSWIVIGRTAYAWNFKAPKVSCFSLTLPQSGLKHHSDLFCVIPSTSSEKQNFCPACINVSPEGVVRYWPKLDRPSSYVENVVELSGQVCQTLKKLSESTGFVLATTTCNLFFVYPPLDRSNVFTVVPIKSSQGVVAGIGRRVSSLFYSSSTSPESKLIGLQVFADRKHGGSFVFVLTSKFLQCYKVHQPNGNYKFLWERDIITLTIDASLKEIWQLKNHQALVQYRPAINIWLIDMIYYDRQMFLLFSVNNQAVSAELHYVIATFGQFDIPLNDFDQFIRLNMHHQMTVQEQIASSLKLRLMHGTGNIFLVGNDRFFVCDTDGDCQTIDVHDDKIIGSGSFATHILVFTLKNGLCCVKFGEKSNATFFAEESATLHQLTHTEDEIDDLMNSSDRYKRFKAAFISFLKQQIAESEQLLEELFQSELYHDLNDLVIQLSTDIVDDYPAADVRWTNSIPSGGKLGVSGNSLLLLYQLEDKRKTLSYFWEFLKRMNIWKQLTFCHTDDGRRVTCQILLSEHVEKLDSCIAVVEKGWEKIPSLMKSVFSTILRKRKEPLTMDLTAQDMFFRRVSKCESLILTLIDEECSEIVGVDETSDRIDIICSVNEIVLSFLMAAQKKRAKLCDLASIKLEFIPWTYLDSMKNVLIKQHSMTSDYVNDAGDSRRVDFLASQLKDLCDCLLSDAQVRLTSLKNSQSKSFDEEWIQFGSWRTKMIEPLLFLNQFEKAVELGENYKDFEILVRVCETTNDTSLMDNYKLKFADQGFSQFLYNWHLNKGKFNRLFEQNGVSVKEFLTNRPDLKWIYDVKNNDFKKAASDLLDLAYNETKLLSRQKTMYSLAKLNALCGDYPDVQKLSADADEGLNLIAYHEKAPFTALKHYDLNPKTMPPLSVKELIEVYVTDEDADEWSFAKALDLLASFLHGKIPDGDFDKLKVHIWALALLKDDWNPIISSDEPLKLSKMTIFSRTVGLLLSICKSSKENLENLFPSSSLLMNCQDLSTLNENSVFQYILSASEEELKNYLQTEDIVSVDID